MRSIWLRNDLENFKNRLLALEKQVNENGIILTDEQVAALERKKHDDEACGEIETAHPGYLGSQDTFYVGNLKGVERIYQQTFVDTYSKVAFAKLYTTKTPITAADMLNEFYQVTFRKKLYGSMEELQKDLDEWMDYYNNHRTHQGKMCCGRTPIETLEDGKSIWAEKNLAQI
ncbi:ISSod13 transposase [Photobacterium damselae subsp. damselae CIP 102761]|uniref:ISSod13 transposase n=2 Tax=Photobacterium damselae TaxID=38293 RepID=D0Z596_PHODD|nr:ISSod13 transposase [Photobacterium damselae subsp. damselae CIP 102761]SPY46099.1 Uncharacterised protein [Photobacterium damselae]